MAKRREANNILYVSTFPPRECGIATFTQDLSQAFDKRFNPVLKSRVCALNEQPTSSYNYDRKVIQQAVATELEQYVRLANNINKNDQIKLVDIQHEFGLYGGEWGDYLIPFLQVLEKPIVTTFHSVIPNPDEHLQKVVRFIAERSKAVVVMNKLSREVLVSEYDIPRSKISFIPHGIPQVPFELSKSYKDALGFRDNILLSTFGLISPDKGIEYAIRALPRVVKQYPNILYLIIGETHPVVRREYGEAYRNFLTKEVDRLGLNNHVKFYDKYLALEEITRFLRATDIYVSTPLSPEQSVSGTLSYALGCGRPVISTMTQYGKHIVNDENGILVRFKNSHDIARSLLSLLADEKKMRSMSIQAYELTRPMIWPNVAEAYFKVYKKFADIHTEEDKLPEIKFDHIMRLTDDFGIFQHARYSKPEKRFGYSLDDIARALIVCAKYYQINPSPDLLRLMHIYLNFMKFAQRPSGNFSNIVSYRKKRDQTNEQDVQGRGIWALGYVLSCDDLPKDITDEVKPLFKQALKSLPKLKSARAIAFAMTGLYHYLKSHPNKRLLNEFKKLANKQVQMYRGNSTHDWHWFEDELTYSNSKLPESLFYAYDLTQNKKYQDIAEKSLEFLSSITFEQDSYAPIGQSGWYRRNKRRSYFDQQPEDAASMVETSIVAYRIMQKKHWLDDGFKVFQWFLGKNNLQQMVYDETTGGCHDGVGQNTLNLNQGAESTISYLLARLALEDVKLNAQA